MAVLVATTDIFYICKRVVCTFYTQQSIIYMIIVCNCLRSFVPFWRPMTLYIDRLPAQIQLWRNIRLGLLKIQIIYINRIEHLHFTWYQDICVYQCEDCWSWCRYQSRDSSPWTAGLPWPLEPRPAWRWDGRWSGGWCRPPPPSWCGLSRCSSQSPAGGSSSPVWTERLSEDPPWPELPPWFYRCNCSGPSSLSESSRAWTWAGRPPPGSGRSSAWRPGSSCSSWRPTCSPRCSGGSRCRCGPERRRLGRFGTPLCKGKNCNVTWGESWTNLFLQLNFRQDSGSEPAASIFSTPGWRAMFLELFLSWKQILSISRARSLLSRSSCSWTCFLRLLSSWLLEMSSVSLILSWMFRIFSTSVSRQTSTSSFTRSIPCLPSLITIHSPYQHRRGKCLGENDIKQLAYDKVRWILTRHDLVNSSDLT